MGIGDAREFANDIARRVIVARKEFRVLHDIHKSDQRIKAGRRIRTPYWESKMEPGGQVAMKHPTCLVAFQTTWVKCEYWGALGL